MVGGGIATGPIVRHDKRFYLFHADAEPQARQDPCSTVEVPA
jgi:hypothetical protein